MGNIERSIIRRKNFEDNPEMEKAQQDCIELTCTQTDELLENYKKLDNAHGGKYVNSDLMKMLYPVYSESKENRNKYNLSVTNSAACLANEFYERQIKSDKTKVCIYIAGPYGAGKSFFAQSLFLANAIPDSVLVYEGSITAPYFGEKVMLAIENGVRPEIAIINPTLELSLQNIQAREVETGRGVIKEEVVSKYAELYDNMKTLLKQVKDRYPDLKGEEYPIMFQIYNKSSNVPKDITTSENLEDLNHGTKEEVSRKYDELINQQQRGFKIFESVVKKSLEDSEPR